MGGLGNQLFQLAAGLHLTNDPIELVIDLGNPRKNRDGLPELASFKMPNRVTFIELDTLPFILSKLCNLGIRIGARSKPSGILLQRYEQITGLFFWSLGRYPLRPHFSAGVGLDKSFKQLKGCLHIGYFQNSQYFLESYSQRDLLELDPREPSDLYKELRDKALKEKPLILHLRLGDYLGEDTFGVPSRNYYESGINRLKPRPDDSPIWVFSNEPEKATQFLSLKRSSNVFLVPVEGLSSAETLNLMRYGSAYVIGNSTFSWWGAMLSFDRNAEVVAPTPWFKEGNEPLGIYPPSWIQIEASYSNHSERFDLEDE
jgi:hypothetical protein